MTRAIFPRALGATATTLGQLMDELAGKVARSDYPYSSVEFTNLIKAWKEPSKQPQRDALSDVHHTNEPLYDYTFGKNLFAWFNKELKGRFQKAFDRIRLLREAGWRTPHSGVSIVSRVADDSIIGKSMPLPANLNRLIGRVAAESEGREIEGQPALRFVTNDEELPELESLEALVLTAATLEPAAQIGDVLLLSPTLPPTENSLVVCHANGAWRARRYGELGASSQHAVLIASSVNPRQIRHPILVDKRPSNFRKVVGIVYRERWEPPPATEDEAADLTNMSTLEGLLSRSIGRIQVVGDSAEPIALQGQYLMSAPHVPTFSELLEHDGRPVVADLDGRVVFKRLRLTKRGGPIVLESLDAAGRHPPIIVSPEEARALGEKLKFWPVVGVLFDTSSKTIHREQR